jgi:hypothetical protein
VGLRLWIGVSLPQYQLAFQSMDIARNIAIDGVPLVAIIITGVQMNADREMLPDSMNGFAPVIKGIARTTADVVG